MERIMEPSKHFNTAVDSKLKEFDRKKRIHLIFYSI